MQNDMDKKYEELKKLIPIPDKKEESAFLKLKEEEMNEMVLIYDDEFLLDFYNGMVE